jgi:hypothetical protein
MADNEPAIADRPNKLSKATAMLAKEKRPQSLKIGVIILQIDRLAMLIKSLSHFMVEQVKQRQ